MRIIKFLPEYFEEIGNALRLGIPVILPTDTSYGFSGSIFSTRGISKIESLKGRENKAFLILTFSNVEMSKFLNTKDVQDLEIFTHPKTPTSFLLPRGKKIPDSFFPDFAEIGARVPEYKPLLGFLHFFGEPIFSTSANFSGKPAIFSRQEILENFSHIPRLLFVDAGDLQKCDCSRIVRVGRNGKIEYLR